MVNSVCLTRNTLLSFEKVSPAQENTFTISILTIYVSLVDSQSRGHHNKIPLSFQLELLTTDLYRIDLGGSGDKIAASYNWRIMGTKLSFEHRQGDKIVSRRQSVTSASADCTQRTLLSSVTLNCTSATLHCREPGHNVLSYFALAHLLPLSADKPPQMLNILWQKSSPFPQRAHVLLYLVSLITFCHTLY